MSWTKPVEFVISFVEVQGGALFAFTDPVSGATAENCRIAGESFDAGMTGEMAAKIAIVIEEYA